MASINYTVLHIFGYGETQVIGKDLNKKVNSSSLTKLQAVVDNVYSKKPADNNAGTDYHAINIFFDEFVDYIGKFDLSQNNNNRNNTFRIDFTEVDSNLIDELITEISAIN